MMRLINKVTSRTLAMLLAIVCIALLTTIDYYSGAELTLSIFYLIPISIIALNRISTKTMILSIAILATVCWFFSDYLTREYSSVLFNFWNAFAKLIIFCTFGLLIFYFRKKHNSLDESNTELNHTNKEKNKFIGMAAHDIRNPISGIYSFSDLLLTDSNSKMNKEEVEIVEHIKTLSENILDLIKNLLDVSKIESGKIEPVYKKQDYVSFIKEHIHISKLLAKRKQIRIHLNLQKERMMAAFDEHLILQVIDNLLSNAIKYSEKNSDITINVTKNEGMITTEVIDYSKGIPMDEQEKLFKYFQKTSIQPTDGESSTGLGLAIVKKVILACHGTIGVKSTVGKGSNFYFSFPVESVE